MSRRRKRNAGNSVPQTTKQESSTRSNLITTAIALAIVVIGIALFKFVIFPTGDDKSTTGTIQDTQPKNQPRKKQLEEIIDNALAVYLAVWKKTPTQSVWQTYLENVNYNWIRNRIKLVDEKSYTEIYINRMRQTNLGIPDDVLLKIVDESGAFTDTDAKDLFINITILTDDKGIGATKREKIEAILWHEISHLLRSLYTNTTKRNVFVYRKTVPVTNSSGFVVSVPDGAFRALEEAAAVLLEIYTQLDTNPRYVTRQHRTSFMARLLLYLNTQAGISPEEFFNYFISSDPHGWIEKLKEKFPRIYLGRMLEMFEYLLNFRGGYENTRKEAKRVLKRDFGLDFTF
jgi:hypothetical protein